MLNSSETLEWTPRRANAVADMAAELTLDCNSTLVFDEFSASVLPVRLANLLTADCVVSALLSFSSFGAFCSVNTTSILPKKKKKREKDSMHSYLTFKI